MLQMKQAAQRGDKAALSALLPQAIGNPLEPWAAYWELKARLPDAAPQEVQAFIARYAGTYQEDRMRNDWLLLSGQRRDWDNFSAAAAGLPHERRPAGALLCDPGRLAAHRQRRPRPRPTRCERNWLAQRDLDDGCLTAADRMIGAGLMSAQRRLAQGPAVDRGQPAAGGARRGRRWWRPIRSPLFDEMNANIGKFLANRAVAVAKSRRELVVLALLKLTAADPDMAAIQLGTKWDADAVDRGAQLALGRDRPPVRDPALAAGQRLLRARSPSSAT